MAEDYETDDDTHSDGDDCDELDDVDGNFCAGDGDDDDDDDDDDNEDDYDVDNDEDDYTTEMPGVVGGVGRIANLLM